MRTYSVHLPPDSGQNLDRAELAERLTLVAEGFSVFAFVLAPVWMLINRLWLALVVYVVAIVALELAMAALGTHDLWQALIGLAIHLVIGFEADEIRRWSLARKGWQSVAVVTGRDAEEGEARFLEGWPTTAATQIVAKAG